MSKNLIRTTLLAGAALCAFAPAASANVALCVPKTAGQTAFSGGDQPGVYCGGSQTMLMPDSIGDQQKLIDLLPYITFKPSGIAGKPTVIFTGVNLQLTKKEYPGFGNTDGTGNLIIGDAGLRYSSPTADRTRYSGSENLIVGGGNEWTGRENVIVGDSNKVGATRNLVQGDGHTVSGWLNFVSGVNRTVTGNNQSFAGLTRAYGLRVASTDNNVERVADGAGTKFKSWNYSDGTVWVNTPGITDVTKCAAAATAASGKPSVTAVRQQVDYKDWVLFFTYSGTSRVQTDVDVTITCNNP